ncbi:hypothetical protein MCUN1_001103 [Malassezia cuniculi]|uniref:Uncharacterized protein n=1 Tax=Malassezia cuniculi TaxID=948313 RepID=A0AAF0EPM5_9BASI|nr:hypothetical protein MCUN1_001103 [Malassezia cuniculi]
MRIHASARKAESEDLRGSRAAGRRRTASTGSSWFVGHDEGDSDGELPPHTKPQQARPQPLLPQQQQPSQQPPKQPLTPQHLQHQQQQVFSGEMNALAMLAAGELNDMNYHADRRAKEALARARAPYERERHMHPMAYAYRHNYASHPSSREHSPTLDTSDDIHEHMQPLTALSHATPSSSPVLAPMHNMSLLTAPSSPIPSRPGSPVSRTRTLRDGSVPRSHSHTSLPHVFDHPAHTPGGAHHGASRMRSRPYPLHDARRAFSHAHLSSLSPAHALPQSTLSERSTATVPEEERWHADSFELPSARLPLVRHVTFSSRSHRGFVSAPASRANTPPDSPLMSPRFGNFRLPPPVSAAHSRAGSPDHESRLLPPPRRRLAAAETRGVALPPLDQALLEEDSPPHSDRREGFVLPPLLYGHHNHQPARCPL